jgi:sulfide dehydrogenase cytochrome subunit
MTHRLSLLYGLLLSGILLTISTHITAADTPTASMLANTCAGCHGTNGSSVGPASPTIAGISKTYFIDTMLAYKKGERPATIMTRIAKGYSDEEIKLMADFFSKQTFVRYDQQFDAAKAKTGKDLHTKYCDKCHENAGRSAEDDAGILAGQWAPYLRYTMEDFTSGSRSMEKKMKKKMEELKKSKGDKGVDALIHFYASQK